MTTTAVTQTGPLFRLEWTLDTPEDVEITRTIDDTDTTLAVVESAITTFIDSIDELDSGTVITWTLIGQATLEAVEITHTVTDVSIPPLDDERRYTATLLQFSRWWKRRDAPLGVAGGGEYGMVHLRRMDPDVAELLVGLRRTDSDLTSQTWPTLAEAKAYVRETTAADADVSPVLNAAIAAVKQRCSGGRGIA